MPEEKKPEVAPPPYVSYRTFSNYLSSLKETGIPARIDASVMKNLSGAAQVQLRSALKYLGLTSEQDVPTELLGTLIGADNDERRRLMVEIIRTSYAPIFGNNPNLDLTKATPAQVSEAFKQFFSGDTVRKAESFFLFAAADAGIPLSKHLEASRKRATTNRNSKPRSNPKAKSETSPKVSPSKPAVTQQQRAEPPRVGTLRESLLQAMVNKMPNYDPAWGEETQAKWFAAFNQLTDRIMQLAEDDEMNEEDSTLD